MKFLYILLTALIPLGTSNAATFSLNSLHTAGNSATYTSDNYSEGVLAVNDLRQVNFSDTINFTDNTANSTYILQVLPSPIISATNGIKGLAGPLSPSPFSFTTDGSGLFNLTYSSLFAFANFPFFTTGDTAFDYNVSFDLEVVSVSLGAPITSTPIPAAAWLFGSAFVGVMSLVKRRRNNVFAA